MHPSRDFNFTAIFCGYEFDDAFMWLIKSFVVITPTGMRDLDPNGPVVVPRYRRLVDDAVVGTIDIGRVAIVLGRFTKTVFDQCIGNEGNCFIG